MLKFLSLAVIALVAVWCFAHYRAHVREKAAIAAHPPQGEFIEVDGHKIHAVVMGAGPDLVLLHGSGAHAGDLTLSLAPKLAENFRVIVIDRPGHGYSDAINPDGASITEQALLMRKAAQTLGANKPIVAGHSYGGAVALAWAVHQPDDLSGLVLLAAASNPWNTDLDMLYKLNSHPVYGRVSVPFISAFVPQSTVSDRIKGVFAPNPAPDGYLAEFGPSLSLSRIGLRANALQRANLLDEIKQLSQSYGAISVPTEILHGPDDTTVNIDIHSRLLVTQIPQARLTELPGVGHMPQHSAQDEVIAAITRAAERGGLIPAQ